VEGLNPEAWSPGTAQATYTACARDLASEEDRLRILDGKLTNLAAFSGVSLAISGSVGGSVLAAGKLSLGFSITLGATVAIAASLLLAGVISAFSGLHPHEYEGITEADAEARLTQRSLERSEDEAWAQFAATAVVNLVSARMANDSKADTVERTFRLVGAGFSVLVVALLITAVGSVV
jgi:hypothetical protein